MTLTHERFLDNHRQLQEAIGAPQVGLGSHPGKASDHTRADLAVRGRIRFTHGGTGTHDLEVGRSNVDWTGGQHRHQEWRAQLHRFHVLVPLAVAYRDTGDGGYADAAADLIEDWMRAHPVRDGAWTMASYDNTLNIAGRTSQWLGQLPILLASPRFDDRLFQAMIESVAAQLDYLDANIADRINWRMHHAGALLRNGLLLDGHPGAKRWQQRGVDVLNDAFHRQVLPQGCHIERNPTYHTGMTRTLEQAWRLGRAFPDLSVRIPTEGIARMHDYALAVLRPDGRFNGMQDSSYEPQAPREPEWDRARARFRADAGLPESMPPTSFFLEDAGQALLRDSWEADATYVTFDATVWGQFHTHLSRNAVQLHAYGRPLIIDPGIFTYESSDPFCDYGKGTRSHSTVTLNSLNQTLTHSDTRFTTLPGYDHVASLYAGAYWPGKYHWGFTQGHGQGMYGEHHRNLLWVRDRFIVVIDHIFHSQRQEGTYPTIEANWQLANVPMELDVQGKRTWTTNDDANVLMLFAQQPGHATIALHQGEKEPIKGWAPGPEGYEPAPMLTVAVPEQQPADTHLVTVLVPYRGADRPGVRVTDSICPEDTSYGKIELTWDDGGTDEIWWTGRMEIALERKPGSFDTDAGMVHLRKDASGKVTGGLVIDGTYIDPYSPQRRAKPETFPI